MIYRFFRRWWCYFYY